MQKKYVHSCLVFYFIDDDIFFFVERKKKKEKKKFCSTFYSLVSLFFIPRLHVKLSLSRGFTVFIGRVQLPLRDIVAKRGHFISFRKRLSGWIKLLSR